MEKDNNGVSGHVEKDTNGVSGHMERFPPPVRDNTWLDRKLKPTTYKTYYPFVGKPLLYLTSIFVSLGDGLFGYDQGLYIPSSLLDTTIAHVGSGMQVSSQDCW